MQIFKQGFKLIRGMVALLGLLLNNLILPAAVIILAGIRKGIPNRYGQQGYQNLVQGVLPRVWSGISAYVITYGLDIDWDIEGIGPLSEGNWYVVVSNHQCFTDILVLEKVFHRRIPKLKFFMKQALLWHLPVLGLSCKIMGYPFLKRNASARDFRAVQALAQNFKTRPTSLLNFAESTRLTESKRIKSRSPYQHLLKPKPLSLAASLCVLADQSPQMIDVTIVYDVSAPSLWKFLFGSIARVTVRYRVCPIDKAFLQANLLKETSLKRRFRDYWETVWRQKDELITDLKLKDEKTPPPSHS